MISNWSFLQGGPRQGRLRRYLAVLILGWVGILVLATAIFVLTPKSYQSGFTLILPGAGSNSSVNLESLGQASSNSASPFGSHSLSPTENYKRLLQSWRLRGKVAEILEQEIANIPAPRIQLANQTKLIFVSVRADTPDRAERLADAWLTSFEKELSALREEEQMLREEASRTTLAGFEEAVRETQSRIIAFQSEHGLISVDQFQDLVAQTENIRLNLDRADADFQVARSEVSRLSGILGISANSAASIMALLSDETFKSLVTSRAEVETRRSELSEIFGENHPELMVVREEYAGLQAGLIARGRALLGYERFTSINQTYYTSTDERASLIGSLVEVSVKLAGASRQRAVLAEQLVETEARVERLAVPATELDALLRDHQVAETVFASALARIDASRTDIFASYPLTQTVETPGLPEEPVTPSKKFVALGVVAGLLLYTIGLALLWIRLPVIRALLKTL